MTGTREGWRPLGSARDAVSRYLGLGLRRRGREEEAGNHLAKTGEAMLRLREMHAASSIQ